MLGQAIQKGRVHRGVAEHAGPFTKGQIGDDEHANSFVELAQQAEQQCPIDLAEGQATVESACIASEPGLNRQHTSSAWTWVECASSKNAPIHLGSRMSSTGQQRLPVRCPRSH